MLIHCLYSCHLSRCNSNVATWALRFTFLLRPNSVGSTCHHIVQCECRILYFSSKKLHRQRPDDTLCRDKGYSEAVKTRVERCAPVTLDVMEHPVISFKCLVYWKNDIKVVEFNELYIRCHLPFSVLCALLWKINKVWFQHKVCLHWPDKYEPLVLLSLQLHPIGWLQYLCPSHLPPSPMACTRMQERLRTPPRLS